MDFGNMPEEELKSLITAVHAELDRRAESNQLPNDVRAIARKWAETFPSDPEGWREVTL